MVGLDSRNASRLEELTQPFVPERLNHASIIACCASRNKARLKVSGGSQTPERGYLGRARVVQRIAGIGGLGVPWPGIDSARHF